MYQSFYQSHVNRRGSTCQILIDISYSDQFSEAIWGKPTNKQNQVRVNKTRTKNNRRTMNKIYALDTKMG